MALRFVHRVVDGERMPPGYGVAWFAWHRGIAVTMPVPFNLLARMLRDAWHYVRYPGAVPANPRTAYSEGYAAGRASLFDDMASMGVDLGHRKDAP